MMADIDEEKKRGAELVRGMIRRGRRGTQMAEVYSVRLETCNKIDSEGRANLYGQIKVADPGNYWMSMIYDRGWKNYESIKPGEMFTITGPSECILANDSFVVHFDLLCENDNEAIRGSFVVLGETSRVLQTRTLIGKQASLSVDYAVFLNAVQANVAVRLIDDGRVKYPIHVYGSLVARENFLRRDVQLFGINEAEEYIKMSPGDCLPLLRSAVTVSLDTNLTVGALLYGCESCDRDIAGGTANFKIGGRVNFTPKVSGTSRRCITRGRGKIEVTVTWIDIGPCFPWECRPTS